MTSDADIRGLLERALGQAAAVIAAIPPGAAGAATPCPAAGHPPKPSSWILAHVIGAEVPVPDDAPAYDRMAGWFGRDPGWTPT